MAMFLCGLEGATGSGNYAGWTLSNVVQCGRSLMLAGDFAPLELNSLAGWSNLGGSLPTIEAGRFKQAVAGANIPRYAVSGYSGDFDFRVDYDEYSPGASDLRWTLGFSDGNYVQYHISNGHVALRSAAVDQWSVASSQPLGCPIRVVRTGNAFTLYYWQDSAQSWTAWHAATTLAYATSLTAIDLQNQNLGAGDVAWWQAMYNAIPTATAGTATSPVYDTADGFRGLGWFQDPAMGAGSSVTVRYRTGPTSSVDGSWTGYATATSWAEVAPSAANRYVQVQVSLAWGSTGSGPVAGPILINGSLDQATCNLLFTRLAGTLCRRTTTTGFQSIFGNPASSSNAYWGRSALGAGLWLAANASQTISDTGTSYNLATTLVAGIDKTVSNFAGSAQLNVEAANYILPGLYAGRSVLLPASGQPVSSAQKTSWTSAINAQITAPGNANFNGFTVSNMLTMAAIWAWEDANSWAGTPVSGQWSKTGTTPYADADAATYWASLSAAMGAGGVFTDAPGHVGDNYTGVVARTLADVLVAEPGYTNAASAQSWLRPYIRATGNQCPRDGWAIRFGRSGHAESLPAIGAYAARAAVALGSGHATARELATRSVWTMLRDQWLWGADRLREYPTRTATGANSGDTSAAPELVNSQVLSDLGVLYAAGASYFAATPSLPSLAEGCTADPGWPVATAIGPDATHPKVQLRPAPYGDTQAGYVTRYQTALVQPARFAANTQTANTNEPSPEGGGLIWQDSTHASSVLMLAPSSSAAYACGKAAAVARSGHPDAYSSTSTGTADAAASASEVVWARGRHVVMLSKLSMASPDSRTISNFGFASAPIPLASGASLANTAATTTTAYAEAPDLSCAAFVRGLTSNLQGAGVPRTGTAWLTTAGNRQNFTGAGVDVTNTASTPTLASPLYCAADFAYALNTSLTPATEAARIGSWSLSGDVATFQYDPAGTPEDVYLALSGQTLSSQVIGASWSVTGSGVQCFTGKSGAADWFGGNGITSVSFGGTVQATLAAAGNLSLVKASATSTQVQVAPVGDLTLHAACLPSGFDKVYAVAWDGSTVDVTSSCTVTPATSVVIPSSLASTYAYGGLAAFQVNQGSPEATFTLTPTAASVLIADRSVGLAYGRSMAPDAASIAITPEPVGFSRAYAIRPGPLPIRITGQSARLLYSGRKPRKIRWFPGLTRHR